MKLKTISILLACLLFLGCLGDTDTVNYRGQMVTMKLTGQKGMVVWHNHNGTLIDVRIKDDMGELHVYSVRPFEIEFQAEK